MLDACLASDESVLVPRSVLYKFFCSSTNYYLLTTATDKPKSQSKCLPVWDLLPVRRDDKRIMITYLQIERNASGQRMK